MDYIFADDDFDDYNMVDLDNPVRAINYDDLLEGNSLEHLGNIDYTDQRPVQRPPTTPPRGVRPFRRPVSMIQHMLFNIGRNPFAKKSQEQTSQSPHPAKAAFPGLLKDIEIYVDPKKKLRRGMQDSTENYVEQVPATRLKKKARSEISTEVATDVLAQLNTATEQSVQDGEDGVLVRPSVDFVLDNDFVVDSNEINVEQQISDPVLDYPEEASDDFVPNADVPELEDHLVIDTDAGRVYGQERMTATGVRVAEYHGVPYAEAPLGDRRFLAPLPPRPWGGVRRAWVRAPSCWNSQASNSWEALARNDMSEDCLYLSIWAPLEKGRAVLVWLAAGEDNLEAGAEMAARGDLLLVRVESRRGALGYLVLGEEVPGNAGLMDQVVALRWVQANIDRFGGNPERVTIMGVGQGADLASLHLISPLACPLFHAAILMSGATPPPLPSLAEATSSTSALGHLLACPEQGADLLACLRQCDAQVLTNQEQAAAPDGFQPVVDGVFVVEQPGDLMEGDFFKKAPVLVGSNMAEGQDMLVQLLPDMDLREVLMLSASELDSALRDVFPSHPQPIQSLVMIIRQNLSPFCPGKVPVRDVRKLREPDGGCGEKVLGPGVSDR